MVLHRHPADLHDSFGILGNTKVDGIRRAILRQVRTFAGVTEVAAVREFPVGWHNAFMSWRGAMPGKTVTQRESSPVRPQFGVVPNRRKEIGTGQEPSQGLGL